MVFIRLTMLMTICGMTKYPISAKNAMIIIIDIALAPILAMARFLFILTVGSSTALTLPPASLVWEGLLSAS